MSEENYDVVQVATAWMDKCGKIQIIMGDEKPLTDSKLSEMEKCKVDNNTLIEVKKREEKVPRIKREVEEGIKPNGNRRYKVWPFTILIRRGGRGGIKK